MTALLIATVVLGACRKPPPPPDVHDAAPPPLDHLAPGEAAEGIEKAYALRLPRASSVEMRFRSSVQVSSTLTPEQLSNFVRARVKSGKCLVGASMTTFEDVVVPAEPKRHLTIEIRPGASFGGARSTMIIRDVTPGTPENLSEADAYKKAGMTPDGKLLDPKHIQ